MLVAKTECLGCRYGELLKNHLVVTLFLTMLVGAGGNAGNQSAIKVRTAIMQLFSFVCRVSASYTTVCNACR